MEKSYKFFSIGINFKKADAELRGKFSLSADSQLALMQDASSKGLHLIVLSTCNRTELFGIAESESFLIDLLCLHSSGSKKDFHENSFVLEGDEAILHFFRLGAGLESQILGDFEIIGQIKNAFQLAKEYAIVNAFLERLVNDVIRISKQVKNKTTFSTNAASTAYAAVQWIKDHCSKQHELKIALFGTGDIGKVTCANLVKHFSRNSITLVNRTREKAEKISAKFEVNLAHIDELSSVVADSDVLIVATNAPHATITDRHLNKEKSILIIDLSVPSNVRLDEKYQNVKIVGLDDLSKVVDETIEARKAEIPKVETIISRGITEFNIWRKGREHHHVVRAFKNKLIAIQKEELDYQSKKIEDLNLEHAQLVSDRIIQKVTKQFVTHLKKEGNDAVLSVRVMNDIFKLEH